jgi:hypothetical protein
MSIASYSLLWPSRNRFGRRPFCITSDAQTRFSDSIIHLGHLVGSAGFGEDFPSSALAWTRSVASLLLYGAHVSHGTLSTAQSHDVCWTAAPLPLGRLHAIVPVCLAVDVFNEL